MPISRTARAHAGSGAGFNLLHSAACAGSTKCFEQLPEQERPYYQAHVAHLLLPLQEKDGSWWDYILYDYHQQYGTAMAISSLVRCSQSTSSVAE